MKRKFLLAVAALVSALSFTTSSQAVTCYIVDNANTLFRFDSSTPGTSTFKSITLPSGFEIVGMAIRTTTQTTGSANPGVGSIWAVASNGASTDFRLVVINPSTGATTQIAALGNLGGSPGVDGWSLAFNPALDRFQFIGVEMNYQINPNTGSVTTQTSFNGFPAYSGAAFTTASFGGTSVFYNIDCGGTPDSLQKLTDVSTGGSPTIVGPLGIGDFSRPAGLAISQSTALFAVGSNLYTINLATGAATNPAMIMGVTSVRGLAILPATFPPALSVTVKIKKTPKTTPKAKLVIKGTAASGAGISLVQYKIGKGSFKNASGTTAWKFTAKLKRGKNVVSVRAQGGNGVFSNIAKATIKRP